MIEVTGLTKFYGKRRVLNDVTLSVPPGCITGFVGPNGAGKSTTLRLVAGLEQADSGTVLIDGAPMAAHARPLSALGCLLDSHWFLPSRSGRDHLRILAAPQSIPTERIDYLLEITELTHAARHAVSTYSLGMRQRLGIAAAFLGDARNYILDEPANGLDPKGMRWLRNLLTAEAEAGKSILLSSHLMSEMAQIATRVAVIDHGAIIDEAALDDFVHTDSSSVLVAADDPRLLSVVEALEGARILGTEGASLIVTGTTPQAVGQAALEAGIALRELTTRPVSLEDAFLSRTSRDEEAPEAPASASADEAPTLPPPPRRRRRGVHADPTAEADTAETATEQAPTGRHRRVDAVSAFAPTDEPQAPEPQSPFAPPEDPPTGEPAPSAAEADKPGAGEAAEPTHPAEPAEPPRVRPQVPPITGSVPRLPSRVRAAEAPVASDDKEIS